MATIRLGVDSRTAEKGARKYRDALNKDVKQPSKEAAGSVKALDASMAGFHATAQAVRGILGPLFTGFAAYRVIKDATSTIAGFEETLATLRGVTGLEETSAEFVAITKTARDLGATTRFSAKEAAEGLLFLSRAGFTAEQSMAAIGGTLNLASAGAIGLGEAADYASNIVSQFGLRAEETNRVVDTLINTANSANTDVKQLAEAMKYAGPVAGALGQSVENAAAAIGVLGDSGIQASQAGTNLRGILLGLADPTSDAVAVFDRLGIKIEELNPQTHSLTEITKRLADANLSAADAARVFGRRNAAAALVLASGAEKVRELTAANEESNGVAQRNADIVDKTLAGAYRSLKSAIEEAYLQAGDAGLLGALKSTVTTITSAIRILGGFAKAEDEASTAANLLAEAIKLAAYYIGIIIARKTILFFISLYQQLSKVTMGIKAMSAALSVSPLGRLALAAGIVITALEGLSFASETATEKTAELSDEVKELEGHLNDLDRAQAIFNRAVDVGNEGDRVKALNGLIGLLTDRVEDFRTELLKSSEAASATFEEIRNASLQTGEVLGREFPQQITVGALAVPNAAAIKRYEALIKLLEKERDEVRKNIDLKQQSIQQQVDEAIERDKARGSIDEILKALVEERQLLDVDEKTRFRVNNLKKAEGLLTKLSTEERVEYLGYLREEIDALFDAKQKLDAFNKTQKEAEEAEKKRADAAKQIDDFINSLHREAEAVRLVGVEHEKYIAIEDAKQIAIAGGIELTQENIDKINAEVDARAAAEKQIRDEADARRELDAVLEDIDRKAQERADREGKERADALRDINEFMDAMRLELQLVGLSEEAKNRELDLIHLRSLAVKSESVDVEALIAKYIELDDAIKAARAKKLEEERVKRERLDNIDDAATGFAQSFGNALEEIVQKGVDARDATEDLVRSLQQIAFEELAQKPLENALRSLFKSALSSFVPSANGNVFSAGRVVPMASGGILSGTTTFPLRGGGTGIANEAGPEAVLPLERDNRGRLGVKFSGGGDSRQVNDNRTFVFKQTFPGVRNANDFRPARRQMVSEFRKATGGEG